jgi:flavin-dependent dehydrogenase
MENKKEKIAIVGAGTVGLYLAWRLSELGHKVTVFEKNQEIEKKACSGLVSERLKNFIPIDIFFIEHQIDSCLINFPQKTINLNFKLIFFIVNRKKLNEKLSELAKKAGAEMIFGKEINEIPEGFDKIIGCDGALSKMRERLSLSWPRMRLGIQGFLPQPNSSKYVETWPTKSGFSWKIPRGNQTEYGTIGSLNSAKKDFEEFCEAQKINFNKNEIGSALIPQPRTNFFEILRGKGLALPKSGNITLCGDAAGLTKPWSGGGVIWGLTAADILIKNFLDFEKYHQEIKRFFGAKIFLGNISNSLVYFLGNNLPFLIPSKNLIDNDFLFS